MQGISQLYAALKEDVAIFDESLENVITSKYQSRKQELLKRSNLLSNIGVPVQKAETIPPSFSAPLVERKIVIKPSAPTSAFVPEPALSEAIYHEILTILSDFGKAMERHPSTYQSKQEESIRDLFLMLLIPHFQSATGETFNKRGKTDILIQHERNNVFVAECKIWKGVEKYFEAIDQILSYLTWRDSKVALILFVQNKGITNVLELVETKTSEHRCFLKYKNNPCEGRYDFEFHLPSDESRNVQLAVLCFHFI